MANDYINPAAPTGPFITASNLLGRSPGDVLDLTNLSIDPDLDLPVEYCYSKVTFP
jgi:hypothetical protein